MGFEKLATNAISENNFGEIIEFSIFGYRTSQANRL